MFRRSVLPLAAFLSCQFAQAAATGAYAKKISETSWSVGNEFVERTLAFGAENGLQTGTLTYKVTGRNFTSHDPGRESTAGEFSFRANNKDFTGRSSFALRGSETSSIAGGRLLRIDLASAAGQLDVSVFYASYDDHPALRKWLTVTNRGASAAYLTHFCFETLSAAPGAMSDLQVSGGYGAAPRELFFTGRVSDPAVFMRNAKTGEGFAILNEAPGYLKRTDVGLGWSKRFMVMYDTDLFPFGRTLNPGETFESAKSSMVFFFDNHGLADSHWVVPRYSARILRRGGGRVQPPWLYNTWEPFLGGINQKTVGELAQTAKEMGLDIFTIDDGWQAEYGANDFDMGRFPAGFAGVKSTLGADGLRLGLWVPLAAISTQTADYRSHPEWVCLDGNNAPKFTGTAAGSRAVMCLASGYRELALKRLTDLIERYHPGYIKVDLTTVFNAYGEQPGCYAPNHLHHEWAESLTRVYEALQYIGEQLRRVHPEVLVDYTFELWGEKHLIDGGLLRCADLDWLSNVSDADPADGGPLHARTLLYSRAPSIPVESMLIGNLRASTSPIEERFATEIGAGPILLGDLRKLSERERSWYAEKIGWFKEFRRRTTIDDSFFPLGDWIQPRSSSWDGFARLSRDSGGIIVLFRNASAAQSVDVQVPAPPGLVYRGRSIITNNVVGRITADDLTKGWKVQFPADHDVQIIELDRQPSHAN